MYDVGMGVCVDMCMCGRVDVLSYMACKCVGMYGCGYVRVCMSACVVRASRDMDVWVCAWMCGVRG